MAVKETQNQKKSDSKTDSSNLHVSTVSKKDTLTLFQKIQASSTPHEILEGDSQCSNSNNSNSREDRIGVPRHNLTVSKFHKNNNENNFSNSYAQRQSEQFQSDFQIEKSQARDDQMDEIVFCNLKDNSANSRGQYSTQIHYQGAFTDVPSLIRNDDDVDEHTNLFHKRSSAPQQQDGKHLPIESESENKDVSDSSELENSFDSEVAKEFGCKDEL